MRVFWGKIDLKCFREARHTIDHPDRPVLGFLSPCHDMFNGPNGLSFMSSDTSLLLRQPYPTTCDSREALHSAHTAKTALVSACVGRCICPPFALLKPVLYSIASCLGASCATLNEAWATMTAICRRRDTRCVPDGGVLYASTRRADMNRLYRFQNIWWVHKRVRHPCSIVGETCPGYVLCRIVSMAEPLLTIAVIDDNHAKTVVRESCKRSVPNINGAVIMLLIPLSYRRQPA